jgi:prepilin-type N-terminal cleavage/methylation domain-containing protein
MLQEPSTLQVMQLITKFITRKHYTRDSQAGFSMVEVLAAVAILSVVGLAVAMNGIHTYTSIKRNERNSVARQLATEKLEEFASQDPSSLTAASGTTELNLTSHNMFFRRISTVTVNADSSITVSVSVSSNRTGVGGAVTLSNTFFLWGKS